MQDVLLRVSFVISKDAVLLVALCVFDRSTSQLAGVNIQSRTVIGMFPFYDDTYVTIAI